MRFWRGFQTFPAKYGYVRTYILPCLTPDDFTCHWKGPEKSSGVNYSILHRQDISSAWTIPLTLYLALLPYYGNLFILPCLTPDDFTCQVESSGELAAQRVNQRNLLLPDVKFDL